MKEKGGPFKPDPADEKAFRLHTSLQDLFAIKYPAMFGGDGRMVQLKGEGILK